MTCFNNSHRFKDVDESLALTKRCWSVDIQCVIYTVHRPHTRYNTVGRGLGGLWWKQDNFLFWNSRRFDYLRRNTPLKTSSNTAYMSALPQVTLPCRVENKIGVIQWTRDGFGLGDTRDLSGYSRYKLIGSDDESKWQEYFDVINLFSLSSPVCHLSEQRPGEVVK